MARVVSRFVFEFGQCVFGITFILSPHHKNSFAEHFSRVGYSLAGWLGVCAFQSGYPFAFFPQLEGWVKGNTGS